MGELAGMTLYRNIGSAILKTQFDTYTGEGLQGSVAILMVRIFDWTDFGLHGTK